MCARLGPRAVSSHFRGQHSGAIIDIFVVIRKSSLRTWWLDWSGVRVTVDGSPGPVRSGGDQGLPKRVPVRPRGLPKRKPDDLNRNVVGPGAKMVV